MEMGRNAAEALADGMADRGVEDSATAT